jgi:hypothetical protein
MRLLVFILVVTGLTGCVTPLYRETHQGAFTGALDVRWVKNDYFLFLPDKDDPLTFKRPNGTAIRPGPMYTDGGSIPRFL